MPKVLKFLKEAGHSIDTGMEVFVYGNIPNGSGLSSASGTLDWHHRRRIVWSRIDSP